MDLCICLLSCHVNHYLHCDAARLSLWLERARHEIAGHAQEEGS